MKKKKGKIILMVILALVCVAGVELAACRYFAPALYLSITEPIRRGYQAAGAFFQQTLTNASDFLEELQPEEPPVNQMASAPVVEIELPPANFSVTHLFVEDGNQMLSGGAFDLHYFNQGDPVWADQPYGSDHIGGYGCGPTAMAMAISSMTDTYMNPAEMSAWAVDHGYWARRSGSYLSIVEGTASAFGLQVEPINEHTPKAMQDALLSGKLLVALMGPGHFTTGGHFILVRGVTLSGEVLVADPNSTQRSLVTWDPQLILDELSPSRTRGAPLWAISVPAAP